jgi:hypothetical protein
MTGIVRFKVWRSSLYDLPERCEFVRETAHYFIRHNGTRDQKKSRFYAYYATQQEAQAAIDRHNREHQERAAVRRVESYGPELLEALKELREAVSAGSYEDPAHDRIYRALNDAGELIKKAEGEKP